MQKIKFNDTTGVDRERVIEGRMLIQANSGGGKSHTTRRFIEQEMSFKNHKQIIVLDPEGEFGNLRSKYDFVYIGKDGDAPAEPRSAALLARRLLELKASAIIDLYELPPQERKHFVRLFCEAMVNAPKELWHDVYVVIDEAHVFAPENGESESTGPVIDLATRGRKRGFAVILATQRLSKLHKDAAAECNNKLIGRTTLDIDRKRAAEELGFTSKADVLSLRDLEPGEFYVFGPAFGRGVEKIMVGDVVVKPPKRGVSRAHVPAPSATVKKMLAQLKDLPQAAAEELRTVSELKQSLSIAKRRITELERAPTMAQPNPKEIKKIIHSTNVKAGDEWEGLVREHMDYAKKLRKVIANLMIEGNTATNLKQPHTCPVGWMTPSNLESAENFKILDIPYRPTDTEKQFVKKVREDLRPVFDGQELSLSKSARQVLTYLHSVYPEWKSKAQLWVATGYAPGGTFNNTVYELTGAKLIEQDGTGKYAAITGLSVQDFLDPTFKPDLSKWDSKLSKSARSIFHILLKDSNLVMTKEELASETGYALGGTFNNSIYELTGKELAIKSANGYLINPEILQL